jgi:hypothetical protein
MLKCMTCRYYVFGHSSGNPTDDSYTEVGECHLNPPVLLFGTTKYEDAIEPYSWIWPAIYPNDGCSKHSFCNET